MTARSGEIGNDSYASAEILAQDKIKVTNHYVSNIYQLLTNIDMAHKVTNVSNSDRPRGAESILTLKTALRDPA